MGIVRFVILLALILAALWLWRRLRRSAGQPPRDSQPMVRCAHCAAFVPQQRAIAFQQQWYCCPEHLPQDRS